MKSKELSTAKSDPSINYGKKDKKVHFADTIGLSLVSVYFIRDSSPRSLLNDTRRKIRDNLYQKFTYERARLLNFLQPLSPNSLRDRLEKNTVCLESITLCDYVLRGSVKVKNIAYEKRVFVRWTIDNWESHTETPASYVPGSLTETTDDFAFELRMPTDLEKNFKLEFAICYEVLGIQSWDNNAGDNFRV
ncbi:predicted protein, partial [Nematostella vectensis]